MSKSSPDLLQALMDRRKAEKAEPSQAATPVVESVPAPATTAVPATPAPLPIVEIKPYSTPAAAAVSPRGISWTLPMFATAILLVGAALAGAFFLGRWSAGAESSTPSTGGAPALPAASKPNIPSPPSAQPFEWAKKFTVEATSSGSSKAELDRLVDLAKYLGKLGVAASPFEVKESGKSVGAIFLGGADSGNDKSLVKLRDWLREIPGPDGTGRPFQSARIRETPKPEKK